MGEPRQLHTQPAAPDSRTGERSPRRWLNSTIIGIVLATFFSDVSHETATAVLPFFLGSIGYGAAALGVVEGVADFISSIAKLTGGFVGHRIRRKKPLTVVGYCITAICTGSLALVTTLSGIVTLRSSAWVGRGLRSPLRDYLLSDAVEPTHFGRAFGFERAGDMIGAVLGPCIGAVMILLGLGFKSVILWTVVPGMLAAASIAILVRERIPARRGDPAVIKGLSEHSAAADQPRRSGARSGSNTRDESCLVQTASPLAALRALPKPFYIFTAGVMLFGMGDFSRTFLVYLAAKAMGQGEPAVNAATGAASAQGSVTAILTLSVLILALHNIVAAISSYPAGHLGDTWSRLRILILGYGLGVLVNLMLAFGSTSVTVILPAVLLSGLYISIEETTEKAAAAQLLPRHQRTLGFGLLASFNALGDMLSSLYIGYLVETGHAAVAFGTAAVLGALGVIWLLIWRRKIEQPAAIGSNAP